MLLVAVAVLVPWFVRDERAFHQFVPLTTQAGLVLSGTYNAQADHSHGADTAAFRPANLVPEYAEIIREHPHMGELEEERRLRAAAFQYAHHHPLYPLKVGFWNTLRLFDLTGPSFPHLVASTIGEGPRAADIGLYS